jgi:hypothetical protein
MLRVAPPKSPKGPESCLRDGELYLSAWARGDWAKMSEFLKVKLEAALPGRNTWSAASFLMATRNQFPEPSQLKISYRFADAGRATFLFELHYGSGRTTKIIEQLIFEDGKIAKIFREVW